MRRRPADDSPYSGAGGKFPRPTRRRPTPYDRPQRLPPPPEAGGGGGWLARLSGGATRIYNSIFGRREGDERAEEPAAELAEHLPSPPSDSNQEFEDHVSFELPPVPVESSIFKDKETDQRESLAKLEQVLLARRIITRDEYDRWVKELRSKIVDTSIGEENRPDHLHQRPEYTFEDREEAASISRANKFGSYGGAFSSSMVPQVLVDPAILPRELAKSYMCSRTINASSPNISLKAQAMREATGGIELYNASKPPYTSLTSLASDIKPAPKFTQNGYLSPRRIGRSEIFRMAGAPCARLPSPVATKSLRVHEGGYTGKPVSLKQTPFVRMMLRDGQVDKQTLKRQNSAVDSNAGHSDSLRRVRQKPDLIVSSKDLSTSASYNTVPPKSSEMAKKIFEHLETKDASLDLPAESELGMARREPPGKLISSMLNERALKSMEVVGSPKLETVPSNRIFNISSGGKKFDSHLSSTGTQKKAAENNDLEITEELTPVSASDGNPKSVKASSSKTLPRREKQYRAQAFQMRVFEDSVEDDDSQGSDVGMAAFKNPADKANGGAGTPKKSWDSVVGAQDKAGILSPAFSASTTASESQLLDHLSSNNELQKEGFGGPHVHVIDEEAGNGRSPALVLPAKQISSSSELNFSTVTTVTVISGTASSEKPIGNFNLDKEGNTEKQVELPRPVANPFVLSGSFGTSVDQKGNNGPIPTSKSVFSSPSPFTSGSGSTGVTSDSYAKSGATSFLPGETVIKLGATSTSSDILSAPGGSELSNGEERTKLASPFSNSTSTISFPKDASVYGLSSHLSGTDFPSVASKQSLGLSSAPTVPSASSLLPNSESASNVNASGSSFGVSLPSVPFKVDNSSSGSLASMFQSSAPAVISSVSDACIGTNTSNPFRTGSALSNPFSFGSSSTLLNSSSAGLNNTISEISSSSSIFVFGSNSKSNDSGIDLSTNSQVTAGNNVFGTSSQLAAGTSLLGPASQPASGIGLFGSSSQPAASNNLFGSGSQLGADTGLLGLGSQPSSGTGVFGSTFQPAATNNLFGSSSQLTSSAGLFGSASQPAATPNLFGSSTQQAAATATLGLGSQSSSASSLFGSITQPAASAGLFSSQAATNTSSQFDLKAPIFPAFGSGFGSSTPPSTAIGSTSSGVSSVPSFFKSSSTNMSSGSVPAQISPFQVPAQPAGFISSAVQNDQMNEDSMAMDTGANVIPNPFAQAPNSSPSNPFGFGSQAMPQAGASGFQFNGFQSGATPPPFAPQTGSFSLGAGASTDKAGRRIYKPRRGLRK